MKDIEQKELLRLRKYVKLHAYCPCCQEYIKCLPDCTFVEDNPDSVVMRMKAARFALTGKKSR